MENLRPAARPGCAALIQAAIDGAAIDPRVANAAAKTWRAEVKAAVHAEICAVSFMTRASSRRVVRMESRVPRNTRRELERRGHIREVDNNVGLVGGDSEVDLDA